MKALGYQPAPPQTEPETTWHAHYRARLAGKATFDDRLFDPIDPVYYVVMHDPEGNDPEGNEFCVD